MQVQAWAHVSGGCFAIENTSANQQDCCDMNEDPGTVAKGTEAAKERMPGEQWCVLLLNVHLILISQFASCFENRYNC